MSVTNGQLANQTTFNNAFVSRAAAQSIAGGKIFSNYVAITRADVATTATITAMASATSFVKLTGSTVTEIQGVTAGVNGQELRIYNGSTAVVSFAHENVGASAANRIDLPENRSLYLYPDCSASLIYDSALSRWVLSSAGPVLSDTTFQRKFKLVSAADNATGSAVTLTAATTPLVSLTNASLVSVAGLPAGESGQVAYLINNTGVNVNILDEDAGATAANRIRTGTAATVTVQDHGTIILIYDSSASRWNMIGGGGGSGSSRHVATFTGTSITPNALSYDQTWTYNAGSSQTFSTTGFGTISSLLSGMRITIAGSSDTNTLTINDSDISDGRIMNGNAVLGRGQSIMFEYNSTVARLIEISRNF